MQSKEILAYKNGRSWQGIVTKVANSQTAAVLVSNSIKHKKYGVYQTRNKTFQVHDSIGVNVGDQVEIGECRKISKTKSKVITRRIK